MGTTPGRMKSVTARMKDGAPTSAQTAASAQPREQTFATVGCHEAAILSWMDDIAPYGIFTTDTELKIESWNEWLETHSGVAAPLAIGRQLFELFPDLEERRMDEHFRRALSGEIIVLSAAFHEYLL